MLFSMSTRLENAELYAKMGLAIHSIQMLHIHDNFRNDDTHAVPFGGNIPWEKMMCALKDVGYTGAFKMLSKEYDTFKKGQC